MNPSVAVIVPTFNNKARLRRALEAWQKVAYSNFEIIVVNDGCCDGTKEMLEEDFPRIVQLYGDGNLWFAGSCNVGLRYVLERGFDYATVFNDDFYVEPEILEAQVECAARHPGAVLGVKAYKYGTDKILWAAGGFITKRIVGLGVSFPGRSERDDGKSFEEENEVDVHDGSGQFYPVTTVRDVGFWDERYKTYYADVEYTLRAKRKGYKIIINPRAIAWHDYEESGQAKQNMSRYPFRLLYLLFDSKSSYQIRNTMRFWFTYYPFSLLLTILRHYAAMMKVYYFDPLLRGKQYRR